MRKRLPSLYYTMIIALAGAIMGLYAIEADVSTRPLPLALTILAVTIFFLGWAAIRLLLFVTGSRKK